MRFLLLSLMSLSLLSSCATSQEPVSNMDVYAEINELHRCSRISPEIEIDDIPPDTVKFDVSLEDRTDLSRIHGGGTWENDGSGIIPEGALTRHYIGACPPDDEEHSYQFVVKAINAQGRVLDENKYIFEQE